MRRRLPSHDSAAGPRISLERRGRARRPFLIGALGLPSAALAACAGPFSGGTGGGTGAARTAGHGLVKDFRDFKLIAYQGEAALGGREAAFAGLFAHGKPVVLNFWAGQCPPCRAEMPAFQKVADEFEGRVNLVGVDVGVFTGLGSHADGRQLLRELAIRYPAGYAVDAAPLRLYNVHSMPTTVFLDATGKVVETAGGLLVERQLRSKLERLVAPA